MRLSRLPRSMVCYNFLSMGVSTCTNASRDVQMIHPGYGFLSENYGFAKAVEDAGLIWVGPDPKTINDLGDKVSARTLADKAGIPTVPGTPGPVERFEAAKDFTDEYGFPII